MLRALLLGLGMMLAAGLAQADTNQIAKAKADLLNALESYKPGDAITPELTAQISDAAALLEAAAGSVDLRASDAVSGLWLNTFSSQGIVGKVDVSFMTRTLPGGGKSGGSAMIEMVTQELRPAQRFYRNMMVMTAGEKETPILYIATADLGISETTPNDLEVLFHTIIFSPGGAGVSQGDVRKALGLGPDTPLVISIPQSPQRKASTSKVTYLDDDLRINRGKNYIAVLRKIQ